MELSLYVRTLKSIFKVLKMNQVFNYLNTSSKHEGVRDGGSFNEY